MTLVTQHNRIYKNVRFTFVSLVLCINLNTISSVTLVVVFFINYFPVHGLLIHKCIYFLCHFCLVWSC